MNLIRHMLKKDIRRFRLPITCGLLIAGLPVLLGILDVQLASKDIQLHALLLKLYFWAAWAQAFFVILMTGIARGEESPSSTTAFWMTRPISPGMVLKAKALFFGIFLVLVPLLSQSLLLALEGVTVRDIAYADLEMAFRLSESIALAWLLAAVTSNYGRFLIAAALVFPLQWLSGCWMLIWKTLYTQSATPFRATALIVSDSIVVAALTILGGAFLIIHQYRTRDTHRTVYSALAGLALLFLVQPLWKWNLQKPSIPRGAGESVSLSLGKYTVARRSGDWTSPKPVMEYWGDLEFAGRNPGDDIRVMGLSTTLVLPDGKTLQDEGFDIDPGYKWFNSPNPQTAQEALGPVRILNQDRVRLPGDALLRLDPQWYQRFLDHPASYRADVDLVRMRYRVEAQIPLTIGTGFRQGSRSVTLLEISPMTNGCRVKLQNQGLDLAFDHNPQIKRMLFFEEDGVFYLLENPKLHEAYLPEPGSRRLAVDLHQAKEPIRLNQETIQFFCDPGSPDQERPMGPEWLKDAVLVRVRMEPVEEFHKPLEVPSFSLVENGRAAPHRFFSSLTYSLQTPTIEMESTQVTDWSALPQIEGKKLTAPGKSLLIDDFEKNQPVNKLGAYWYDQSDKGNLGTVINPMPFKPQEGGSDASPKFAARIWGHWGKEQYPWPFANMGCGFDLHYDYTDLGNFSAFRFWTKGDGKPYQMMVERAAITDYAYFQSGFTAHSGWSQVTLPFSDFHQPVWGKPVPPGWADVRQIQFSPDASVFSDEDFDLWVNDIELLK